MWIMLSDAMFSIVSHSEDKLLVRARGKGHIEKVFVETKKEDIHHNSGTDYAWRAFH